MAKVSNYTFKAKRRYFDGSSWKVEDLDFFQLASKTIYSGSNILYKREENLPNSVGITDAVYDYYPGLVYKPKKYYRITDLFFTQENFENLRIHAKNAFTYELTKEVYGYINASDNSIVLAENNGLYMYPFARYTASVATGIPNKRRMQFWVEVLVTKFSPGNLKFSYENGKHIITVNDNGTWREAKSGEYYTHGRRLFNISTSDYVTYSEWCLDIDNLFNNVLKLKFYFTALLNSNLTSDITLDGIKYGQSANTNTTSNLKYSGLVADCSELPEFSNHCFSFIYFWVWYDNNTNLQVLRDISIDTTNSPDPTRNPDDDDPNDDDSGSQGGEGGGDGDDGGDGDHDDSTDPVPEPPIPGLSGTSNGLITAWNLSPSQLATLAQKLWSPDAWDAIKQYFTNPMGAILSLSIIPVAPKTSSGVIHLGGYNTEITANKLGTDYVNFDCGSIPINRYYGSYLDYSPFTKISCYLPYIGEVDIDPDQIMQKTLQIKYHINCITGECVALLLADGSVFANYSGNCAKQMPICQSDFSAIISSSVQLCSTLITAGAAGASAGAAAIEGGNMFTAPINGTSAIAASESLVKANSSLLGSVMSAKMNYKHSSQLGTGAGQLAPQAPFLTIIRPNLDLADNYKSFTGYPCNKNLDLSSLHGFTQVEACNLSVPSASLEEISEIKELLLKGVIL